MRKQFVFCVAACAAVLSAQYLCAAAPKNVILFIGDGMGHEAIKASGYYFNGAAGQYNFENFNNFAWMTTNNSLGGVTDSAASATAMSTGYKVDSNVISMGIASGIDSRSAPNNNADLQTILERFKLQGKSTGIVTNSFLTDASPAAFGAHTAHRSNTGETNTDYFNSSQPNVLLGGGGNGLLPSGSYTTVTNRTQLQSLSTETSTHVVGAFGTDQFAYAYDQAVGASTFYNTNPYLHEMTSTALNILDNNSNGFFLVVENELTDAAGHAAVSGANKIERSIYEVREISYAVQKAIDFAASHPDTLILVTSDHETGSFTALQNNGVGVLPTVVSGGTSHNATWVPLYASGPNASHVFGKVDNTDVSKIAMNSSAPQNKTLQTRTFRQGENSYTGATDTQVRLTTPTTTQGSAQVLIGNSNVASTSQIALSFGNLFGPAGVPTGSEIVLAKLTIFTNNNSNSDGTNNNINLFRLLVPFDENTTWNTAGLVADNGFNLNGAGTLDDDYLATPEDIFPAPDRNALATFDVTASITAWLAAYESGNQSTFGWMLLNSATDSWQINSSEAGTLALRPMLEITYLPEPGAMLLIPMAGLLLSTRKRKV